jgi:hypothetical protein
VAAVGPASTGGWLPVAAPLIALVPIAAGVLAGTLPGSGGGGAGGPIRTR